MTSTVDSRARNASTATIDALHPLQCYVRPVTYDNGSEFAERELIDCALVAKAYFAEPHSPWQRGTNENSNGLVRQYLRKRIGIAALTDEQLEVMARGHPVENKLNNRPQKTLGFRTLSEVFFNFFNRRTS